MEHTILRDVRINYSNFSGKANSYNPEGERNFSIVLDDVTAAEMFANGWNVKSVQPEEEGGKALHCIRVSVSYRGGTPTVCVSSPEKTWDECWGEEKIGDLDSLEFEKVDVILSPRKWAFRGKSGVKAYLGTMRVTVKEKT